MKLTDLTPILTVDLPLAALRDHLRLGTGFADDTLQDPLLERALRAAISAIEGRTGKILLQRNFRFTLWAWRDPQAQPLPVAPVVELLSVTLRSPDGDGSAVDPQAMVVEADPQRPLLRAAGFHLPAIPARGSVEITFSAGFSADWEGVPADLGQAVMLLAASFYEHRDGAAEGSGMPAQVARLVERYRTVRIIGGAP